MPPRYPANNELGLIEKHEQIVDEIEFGFPSSERLIQLDMLKRVIENQLNELPERTITEKKSRLLSRALDLLIKKIEQARLAGQNHDRQRFFGEIINGLTSAFKAKNDEYEITQLPIVVDRNELNEILIDFKNQLLNAREIRYPALARVFEDFKERMRNLSNRKMI